MQRIASNHMLALLFAGLLASGPALADKPDWAGDNKHGKHEQQRERDQGQQGDRDSHRDYRRDGRDDGRRDGDRRDDGRRSHFSEREREIAHGYFVEQYRSGRCPPGLAKKHNGCMPPGQARKWAVGRPLPRDVVYYDLPPSVVVQLGPPPARHRYVRVASDILLIAVGTGMVVDALDDLGRQ
ncbi:MAG TPA: hypothetical protein VFW53_07010 [Gallionella sp.]|nr:hypothetical protein [Gallionella sp.]